MEIVGRTLQERIIQAVVVFLVLLAIRYYRGAVDWISLVVVVAVFFVVMIAVDYAWRAFVD